VRCVMVDSKPGPLETKGSGTHKFKTTSKARGHPPEQVSQPHEELFRAVQAAKESM
jgi:hypothetical protein